MSCENGHVHTKGDCSYRNGEWEWPCDCGQLSRDFPPSVDDDDAAHELLIKQIEELQTYAVNVNGSEFGGLIERDKVLAVMRALPGRALQTPEK